MGYRWSHVQSEEKPSRSARMPASSSEGQSVYWFQQRAPNLISFMATSVGPIWNADAAETAGGAARAMPAMEPSHRLTYCQTPARKGSSSSAPTTPLIARPSEVLGNDVLVERSSTLDPAVDLTGTER